MHKTQESPKECRTGGMGRILDKTLTCLYAKINY